MSQAILNSSIKFKNFQMKAKENLKAFSQNAMTMSRIL